MSKRAASAERATTAATAGEKKYKRIEAGRGNDADPIREEIYKKNEEKCGETRERWMKVPQHTLDKAVLQRGPISGFSAKAQELSCRSCSRRLGPKQRRLPAEPPQALASCPRCLSQTRRDLFARRSRSSLAAGCRLLRDAPGLNRSRQVKSAVGSLGWKIWGALAGTRARSSISCRS